MFEKLSNELADLLKTGKAKDNVPRGFAIGGAVDAAAPGIMNSFDDMGNTVGHAIGNIFGGAQDDITTTPDSSNLGQKVGKLFSGLGKQDPNENALGMKFYNSPLYLTSHYMQLGKFFQGTEPGNYYTNRYTTPPKPQPIQAETVPNLYARWYQRMREFAEAEEVSNTGKVTVRSR